MPHQKEMMHAYVSEALNMSDVTLQLPTGSGKTLVGLLIAEWRRRKYQERIVYLCPTRQLINQVVEQAEEKYGLTVIGFTGSAKDYDQTDEARYHTAKSVAVTTYSSLFNIRPYFNNAEVLIVDDVHAAENYVSELWSLRVERQAYTTLHTALRNVIKSLLDSQDFIRLSGECDSPTDLEWVDKIPTPEFMKIESQVMEVLDAHVRGTDLGYSWSMIRDHLDACHVYISSQDILIRPLVPPT